jgi:hypothetical protein
VRGWNLRGEYGRIYNNAIGLVQFEYIKEMVGDAIGKLFCELNTFRRGHLGNPFSHRFSLRHGFLG